MTSTSSLTEREPTRWKPKRPWCVRCSNRGTPSWAEYHGVVCAVHWWDLSDETRARIVENIRKLHPRGGRVRSVTRQMWVTARSDARAEWAAVEAELAANA